MQHDPDQEQHDIRVVNRASHIAQANEIAKWRSTTAFALNGGGAIALTSQVKDAHGLVWAIGLLIGGAVTSYLAAGQEAAAHNALHVTYEWELVNNDSWTRQPGFEGWNRQKRAERIGVRRDRLQTAAISLFALGSVWAGFVLASSAKTPPPSPTVITVTTGTPTPTMIAPVKPPALPSP